jgi:hypothetical protein
MSKVSSRSQRREAMVRETGRYWAYQPSREMPRSVAREKVSSEFAVQAVESCRPED